MFKFNFDTSKSGDEPAALPEPQSVAELAPSKEVMPTAEVGGPCPFPSAPSVSLLT